LEAGRGAAVVNKRGFGEQCRGKPLTGRVALEKRPRLAEVEIAARSIASVGG